MQTQTRATKRENLYHLKIISISELVAKKRAIPLFEEWPKVELTLYDVLPIK